MRAINIRGVEEGLWRRVRQEAAKEGKTLREWVIWVLEGQFSGDEKGRAEGSGGKDLSQGSTKRSRKTGKKAKGSADRESSKPAKKLTAEEFFALPRSGQDRARREGRF
jgi:hypothetical protein